VTEDGSFPHDIYTEPDPSPDTLANLGPLTGLAGRWTGTKGVDDHPVVDGAEADTYTETWDLEPIDAQTNGPQLFYGLRYHQRVVQTGEVETFHDQVGYLLWEPARQRVLMTLAIPRGQVAMATGAATPDATTFTLRADVDDPHSSIVTNDFLDWAFRTTAWSITFTTRDDSTWSYSQTTRLEVRGREPVDHTDAGVLHREAPPTPNPTALAAAGETNA
jgi:hypothetical protein